MPTAPLLPPVRVTVNVAVLVLSFTVAVLALNCTEPGEPAA